MVRVLTLTEDGGPPGPLVLAKQSEPLQALVSMASEWGISRGDPIT